MSKAIGTAVLFEAAAYRFAQAFVWRSTQFSASHASWHVDLRQPFMATDVMARSALNSALARAKMNDEKLQAAVRKVIEGINRESNAYASSRGFELAINKFGSSEESAVVPLEANSTLLAISELGDAAQAHELAMVSLIDNAARFKFKVGGAFNQALATFERNRHWEALNMCLAEMAAAGSRSVNPEAQNQGRAAEILGGLWTGDFRLMQFCEAALYIQAHRSISLASASPSTAAKQNLRRCTAAIDSLGRKGQSAATALWKAQALTPLIDVNDADYVGLDGQVAGQWRTAN